MNERIDSFVDRDPIRKGLSVYFSVKLSGDRVALAQPVQFEVVPEHTVATKPTLIIRQEDAQILMDELWRAGLRPTEGTGSAGALAATEGHLKDMQNLAYHLLNVKGQ